MICRKFFPKNGRFAGVCRKLKEDAYFDEL